MGDPSCPDERRGAESGAPPPGRWGSAVPWVLAAAFVGLALGAIVVGAWSTLGL